MKKLYDYERVISAHRADINSEITLLNSLSYILRADALLSLVWKALLATASYRLSGTSAKVRPLICSGVYKIMKLVIMYHASVLIRTAHTFVKVDTYCASQWPYAYHQRARIWPIKLPNSFNGYVCCSPCETGSCCYRNMSDIIMLHNNGITWPRYSPNSCRPQMGPMLAPWTLLSGITWTILKLRWLKPWGAALLTKTVCSLFSYHAADPLSRKNHIYDSHSVIRDENWCYYSMERWGANIYRNIPALVVSLL